MPEVYPSWIYHPTKGAVLVQSEAQKQAYGDGWCFSRADFGKAAEVEPPPAEPEKPKRGRPRVNP